MGITQMSPEAVAAIKESERQQEIANCERIAIEYARIFELAYGTANENNPIAVYQIDRLEYGPTFAHWYAQKFTN